jgi:hypothetical protein
MRFHDQAVLISKVATIKEERAIISVVSIFEFNLLYCFLS